MTVTVLNISTWQIVINLGIIFLLSVYTYILCYSLIIYICSMYINYFMHSFIIISSFSSFPHSIICNPLCCDEKCFILFPLLSGLFCIIVLLFVACSFSFTSSGAYYSYHSQTPFQNQTDRIGNRFEILFPWMYFNFPNQ